MNQEIKKLWVEALRSGRYQQTKKRLRDEDGFCCLGVLCEVYREQTGIGQWKDGKYFETSRTNDTDGHGLPEAVQEWAGLDDPLPNAGAYRLYWENDNRADFPAIAKMIEENL